VRGIKARKIRGEAHRANGEIRNNRKTKGTRPLGRSSGRLQENINRNLKETVWTEGGLVAGPSKHDGKHRIR
jgi:hypothetical protein